MKVVVLLISVLLRECSCCPSFTSSVEEGRAVCPGDELTYTCTIFDGTGFSSTVWMMPCPGGVVVVLHNTLGDPPLECGPFSAQLTANESNCYTSTLTVTASPELNGTVVRCDSTDGSATIMIETGMLELVVTPTYENSELEKIMSTWNAICSPMTEYSITVTCGTSVDTSLVSLAECPGGTCVSEVDIASGATGDCTVSVSAAALNEQRQVPVNNEFFDLSVIDDASPTVVMYSFQPGYPGEACLQIEFSYRAENSEVVNVTTASSVCGDSTGPLKAFIPPATPYSYVASTFDCGCGGQFQQSVIIEGAGTTENYDFETCMEDLLLRNDIDINSCGDGDSATVTITYLTPNVLTPGSTAMYACCSGYRLIGNDSTQLTCRSDGSWDGTPPVCDEILPSCDYVCWIAIILGVLLLISVVLLPIAFLVLCCFIALKKKSIKAMGYPDDAQDLDSPQDKPTTRF